MAKTGWVVVVEAEPTSEMQAVEEWRLRRLLLHMPGIMPIGLHGGDRVAVQVHIDATDEVAALGLALTGLRAALPKVGLRELPVVRAEVITKEEFDRDCELTYGDGLGSQTVASGQAPELPTRAPLRAVPDR